MTDADLIEAMADAMVRQDSALFGADHTLSDLNQEDADDYRAGARAALAVVREREGWRPIETAPRDGSPILTLHPYGWASPDHKPPVAVSRWDRGQSWSFNLPGNYMMWPEIEPTHWRPLPPPPEGE